MSGFDAFDRANADQQRATLPGQSAWVEANAGTGKTKVLTDRVTRLLLGDAAPQRILCLTFTKAAAAEMRNRLAGQLGRWAMADQATLDKELMALGVEEPTEALRIRARRLFARVLDAPGGINILTIHAFCQALLKRFPLEASVAPGFEVMDEAEATTLLREAQNEQIEALARADAPDALRQALASVAGRISIAEYAELMAKLLGERAWLLGHIADEAGLLRMRRQLARQLQCDHVPPIDAPSLREAARALVDAGGKTDPPRGQSILTRLASGEEGTDYRSVYFTDRGQLRKTLASKAAVQRLPDIGHILAAEAERLEGVRGISLVDLTVALLRLGLDITWRYDGAKRRRAALDYDDLIVATRRLLEGAESASWVLYKLDGGIDHVLVDEAQDTNPDQWEVIRRLTEEFFVGEGAVQSTRTIFAVGDTKQSIFGFQRADPLKLAEMRGHFEARSQSASKPFAPVDLIVSFRSTPAVLDAVDWVFARDENVRGLADPGDVIHQPSRTNDPGRVELWPLVADTDEQSDASDYGVAPRRLSGRPPADERLARTIAMHAKGLIGRERRARNGEKLHAGNLMVLVRRRNAFVNALVRALKREGIEVAGVDRLSLGEELAIQDLLSLARFVLLPQDDLNLASLLKSPLIGLDDDQLFRLAWKRTGHLWRQLRARAQDPTFSQAYERLSAWLRRADYTTPFDFFADVLGSQGGRRHLLERLGREAADPIDELLTRALQYQHAEAGSLQGFLRWFEAGGGEIKRDLDTNRRQEVRILTVHAAKGLQAPIVYLPDTTRVPREGERLLPGEGDARLWLPRSDDANEAAREWRSRARRRAEEEQNRLLYVAMTRAEDRLYVGGWIGARKQDQGCWYDRIAAGLEASIEGDDLGPRRSRARKTTFDFGDIRGEGYELINDGHVDLPEQEELPLPEVEALPSWAGLPAPPEPDPPRPLTPSQPLPDESVSQPRALSPLDAGDQRRWQRGRLMHELLRHIPDIAPPQRAGAAEAFLGQPAHGLSQAEISDWVREALGVIEAPEHAALFAEGSRAEVPLIGTLNTPRGSFTVSGQVDRLAVTDREVLIVDYKTNRPPPRVAADTALAYRRQLALYRALLREIYPGRAVRAFLLWTAAPSVMEIDAESLDRSMPYASVP